MATTFGISVTGHGLFGTSVTFCRISVTNLRDFSDPVDKIRFIFHDVKQRFFCLTLFNTYFNTTNKSQVYAGAVCPRTPEDILPRVRKWSLLASKVATK